MQIDEVLADESRLQALAQTRLLDTEPEESFDRLSRLASRLTDSPIALVSLVDASRQFFKSCIGLTGAAAAERQTPLTHSICQHALAQPHPLVISDTRLDPRTAGTGAVEDLQALSYLGVPLVDDDGHVLGSFCVIDHRPREWTDDQVELMQELAESVMAEIRLRELALERRTTAEIDARNEARLRAITNGLFIFAGLLDSDGVVIEMNTAALDAAGLSIADVRGQQLWETHWFAWDPAVAERVEDAVRRARDGEISRFDIAIRTLGDAPTFVDFQLVPILEEDDVVGMVPSALDISDRKQFEDDLARMADMEAEQRRRAEALLDLARPLAGMAAVDDILHHLAGRGAGAVGADIANVAYTGTDGAMELLRSPDPTTAPSLADALSTGEPQSRHDAGGWTVAAMPISGGRAAVAFAWSRPIELSSQLWSTVGIIGQLAGQALDRATLYERERQVADQLQRALLPHALPDIDGLDVAARYVAGQAGMDVGGDWYDVTGDDTFWTICVGDVVGRGLRAAAAMGQIRNACGALARQSVDVSELASALDVFSFGVADARFSTAVLTQYDTVTRELQIVSAGHLPPLRRDADGSVTTIEGGGPPLGFADDVDRARTVTTLSRGDCILLYTDGLVERRGESIDAGLARLVDTFRSATADTAAGLVDAVVTGLADDADDDVAVVCLRVL